MTKTGEQQTQNITNNYNDFYRIAGELALIIIGV